MMDEFVYKLCTEGKNFAAIGTVMPDGSPHVSIVWIDADEDYIYVNTAEGRVKPENLRRDNRVALSIFDAENLYKQAMVKGTAVEDTEAVAEEHIHRMAKKYLGLEKYPHGRPDEIRIVFKIKPESVFKLE